MGRFDVLKLLFQTSLHLYFLASTFRVIFIGLSMTFTKFHPDIYQTNNLSVMKKSFRILLFLFALPLMVWAKNDTPPAQGKYKLVIEGFDWGPAVSKVILQLSLIHISEPTRPY